MQRIEKVCPGKLVVVWGLYGVGVAALWQFLQGQGAPDAMTWAVAALVGVALLVWTREI